MSAGQVQAYVRMEGAALRQYLTKVGLSHGPEMSLAVAKRCVWELADLMGELHGPTAVHEMLDEARAGFQLDAAPPIVLREEQSDLALAANAIEGLTTVTNQNRVAIATLVDAVGALMSEVRHGRA